MRRLAHFWRNERGTSAVELSLVIPVFASLTLGVINLCAVLYAYNCLHFTVEDTARCRSVKTAVCTNTTTAQAYASTHYYGPPLTSQAFVVTGGTCGATGTPGTVVTGTGSYGANIILKKLNISLSATACFPTN